MPSPMPLSSPQTPTWVLSCFLGFFCRGVFTKPIDSSSLPQMHIPKTNGEPKRCATGLFVEQVGSREVSRVSKGHPQATNSNWL